MALPIVAVVGRPNVGKSTFVNRIAQAQDAIVHEARGVTRDRSYHRADWNGVYFLLIDTGGIESGDADAFQTSIRDQAFMAADEADAIVFLVDGRTGVAPDDQEVARILKRTRKPVFLVVNKVDNPGSMTETYDFWSLGLETPWPVSATHGNGTGDLLDAIVEVLPSSEQEGPSDAIDVAIIGRPNAGKSSLLNRMTGVERAIVSDVPGTTRDAIDMLIERDGVRFRLIDTAGIRRKSVIDEDVEYYGFVRAMRAIDQAHVALLVIDSTIGLTDQDQRIARFAEERGCAMIILLNKWDVLESIEEKDDLVTRVTDRLGFVGFAPVLRISALTGRSVDKIWGAISAVYENYVQQISTSQLNKLLSEMREFGHTKNEGGKSLRLQYVTQTRTSPPGFTFFANHPGMVDDNYRRYVENRLRERFDLTGTPVLLRFRSKD
ncbi:MAG: ribosome biogenesis GTPase Der [Coriobacteriia bacterium]|nr:ribosome biogenesis GTPase Der [Coriobacteriia bacterium]